MKSGVRVLAGLVLSGLAAVVCTIVWTLLFGDRFTVSSGVMGAVVQGCAVLVGIPFLQGIITASVGRLRGAPVLFAGIAPLLNAGALALISIGDPEASRDLGSYAAMLVLSCSSAVLGGLVWSRWTKVRHEGVSLSSTRL